MEIKRTMVERAMALVDAGEMSAFAAAKFVGMKSPGQLYRALAARRERLAGRCPCCNQPLPAEKRKDLTAI